MFSLTLQQRLRRHSIRPRQQSLSRPAISRLLRLLWKHDPSTASHSLRVCRYALRLAKALGLDLRQRRALSLAAHLHDIGKLAVPKDLLQKPASLTPAEYGQLQEHPAKGERLLTRLISNPAILAAIRGHHERFDGSGYPDSLRGERIPLLARILAIADSFDAMTRTRTYRAALPGISALAILHLGAGTQFDPQLVEVFSAVTTPSFAF